TEMLVLFATLARQPHVWPAPAHDTPRDLVARLTANGFRDMGAGMLMALGDPVSHAASDGVDLRDGVTIQRLAGLDEPAAAGVADALVEVLADAFDIAGGREAGVQTETEAALRDPRFTHYLVREEG